MSKSTAAVEKLKNLKIRLAPKMSKLMPKKEFHAPDHFSVSSIADFMCCRRRCWYGRIRRLQPKLAPDYYYIGRIWHEALEVLYSWQDYEAAVKQIKRSLKAEAQSPWFTAEQFERMATDRAVLTAMLNGYFEIYGKGDFKTWRVLRSEVIFNLPDFMNSGFGFTGRMDSIVRINKGKHKGIWVLENKTAGSLSNYHLEQAKIDPQLLGYVSAARHIVGEAPRGVIWNLIRKPSIRQKKNQTLQAFRRELQNDYVERPSFYYYRDYLPVSLKAVEAWESEVTNILLDFELACQQLKDPYIWYKNPGFCFHYGRCPYLSLCTRGETTRTLSLFRSRSDDELKVKTKNKGTTKKKSREKTIKKRRQRQSGKSYKGV